MSRIYFFGGKGGVGKTSCSSAFAVNKANAGEKVLLISTDPAHSVSDLFECEIGSEIVQLRENLFATEINPEEESSKYIEGIRAGINNIYSPIIVEEINKQLDAAKVSPGSHESALFDKMIEIINRTSHEYDYVIFDTAPTGHTVRLLSLPDLLETWINTLLEKRKKTIRYKDMSSGRGINSSRDEIIYILERRRNNLVTARRILLDSGRLGFVFVLNAEKLAIDETKKAVEVLKASGINIDSFVVNRILPESSNDEFWVKKKEYEAKHLKEIEETFSDYKIYKIPLLVSDMDSSHIDLMAKEFN